MTVRDVHPVSVSSPEANDLSWLQQAEIFREQAREAARLKRYKAALGLFSTAATLCRNASENDKAAQSLDLLHQIDVEAATYQELARSMNKPLNRRAA